MDRAKTLGIIGGLGPMATVYFYELITGHTDASCDQEHLDIVISSHATTPDRTRFILGRSAENPVDAMIADAKKLVAFGAELLTIPCNTAHYFYKQLQESVPVPILNIVEETVRTAKASGAKRIGILATEGTVRAGSYQKAADENGIACEVPDGDGQAALMDMIYGQIKRGLPVDMTRFRAIADGLFGRGCDRLILGCTELSLIARQGALDAHYLDSMDALAYRTILACGKRPVGFPDSFGYGSEGSDADQ